MSAQQFQAKYGFAPKPATSTTTPKTGNVVKMSPEQFQAKYGFAPKTVTPKSPYDTGNVFTSPILSQPKGGSFSGALARSPVNIPTSAARNIAGGVSAITHPVETLTGATRAISGGLQEAMGGYKSMLTGKAPEKIDNQATQTFDTIVKSMQDRYGSWENIKRTIAEDPTGFALDVSLALEGGGGALTRAGVETGADISRVGRAVNPIRISAKTVANTVEKIKGMSLEKGAINEWEKPATTNKPSYTKATELFKSEQTKGHNIAQTLVKNKIIPSDHIEGGQYATAETADKLRSDAGKLSSDLLRPSLERASYSVPLTPVNDVVNSAIRDIKGNKYLTAEEKATITSKLEATRAGLKKQYPNGMKLVDLHDEKILRGSKVKRSPIGDPATNIEAQKNEAISDTLMTMVEDKAPKDIPVGEFNAELKKQYRAADYLDFLQSKKAPASLISKMAKTSAKVVGAAVGHGLGGGLLGGVGGYHIGGMVESMIEELPNPIKSHFLQNLEISNPPVFQQVKNYLGEQEVSKLMMKALPSPEPLGTAKNPILTPPPTTFEKPAQKIATEPSRQKLLMARGENPIPAQSPKSLETKGAVAAPMSKMSKNSIETNTATKPKTFQESLTKANPIQEAPRVINGKTYNNWEEFAKGQGETLYHGTSAKFDAFNDSLRGSITGAQSGKGAIWFTNDPAVAKAYSIYASETGPLNKLMEQQKVLEKIAQKSGKESDWVKVDELTTKIEKLDTYDATSQRRLDNANVKEAVVKGNFYEVDAKGKTPQELSSDGNIDSWLNQQLDKARKLGKNGVKFKNLDDAVGLYDKPSTHYAIFDSKNITTKSQLTDIWNKANKK